MQFSPAPVALVDVAQSANYLRGGRQVTIRPAVAADVAHIQAFVRGLSPRTRYYRYCGCMRELPNSVLATIAQADGERSLFLLALPPNGSDTPVAMAEYVAQPGASTCEIALVVNDAWQGCGLGSLLLTHLIERERLAGLTCAEGYVLGDNLAMLGLVHAHEFEVDASADDCGIVQIRRMLTSCANAMKFPQRTNSPN